MLGITTLQLDSIILGLRLTCAIALNNLKFMDLLLPILIYIQYPKCKLQELRFTKLSKKS